MKYTKYYRMWMPDIVEPEGGHWCYMGLCEDRYLWQLNFHDPENEEPDTLEQYLAWGYKVEQL